MKCTENQNLYIRAQRKQEQVKLDLIQNVTVSNWEHRKWTLLQDSGSAVYVT